MKILILGADGKLGNLLVQDFLKEKINKITTLTRKPFAISGTTNIVGDVKNIAVLEKAAKGMNVIVSTLGSLDRNDFTIFAQNVAKVASENNIFVVWSGGAGTLVEKDGSRVIDSPASFWDGKKGFEEAVFGQSNAFDVLKNDTKFKWIYLSPAETMDYNREQKPFKLEISDKALYNKDGQSIIGYKTQAAALVKLAEHHTNDEIHKRLTTVEI